MPRRKQDRPKRMKYSADGKEEEEEGDDDQQSGDESGAEDNDPDTAKVKDMEVKVNDNVQSEAAQDDKLVEKTHRDTDSPNKSELVSSHRDSRDCESKCNASERENSPEVKDRAPRSPSLTPPPKSKIADASPIPISRKDMLLNRNNESSANSKHVKSKSQISSSAVSYSSDVDLLLKLVDNVHTRVGSPVKESPIKSLSNLNDRISSIGMRPKPPTQLTAVEPTTMYYHQKHRHHQSPTPKKVAGTYLPPNSPRSPSARDRPLPPYSPYTPPSSVDPDQPLDLSLKPKAGPENGSLSKYSPRTYSAESAKDFNSLADLEKKFGGNSFLLDKIGKKTTSSSHRNAFMSAFGVNLYSSAIYSSHHLLAQAQLQSTSAITSAMTSMHHKKSIYSEAGCSKKLAFTSMSPETASAKYSSVESSMVDSIENRKHTNLQCSCAKEFDTLYHLTLHLQDTGHPPFKARAACHQDYPKLVRGQDMWLNQGSEQTRQILRCMQCGESFKSLPELTVHMMQTKHYTNIVGPESHKKAQKLSSNASLSDSSDNESGFYKCQLCTEVYEDCEGLAVHIDSTHNRTKVGLIPEHSIKSERASLSPFSPTCHSPELKERNGPIDMETKDKLKRRLSQSSDEHPVRKTPRRDSESSGYEACKIRCENCAEKIDTEHFVEHVRACVKTLASTPRRPVGVSSIDRDPDRVRSPSSTPLAPPVNGEIKIKQEKKENMDVEPDSSEEHSETVHSSTELVSPPPLEESQGSACALKAMENFIERSFTMHNAKKSHINHHSRYFAPSGLLRSSFMPVRSHLAKNYLAEPLPSTQAMAKEAPPASPTSVLPPAANTLYQNKYLPPTYMAPSPPLPRCIPCPSDLSMKPREDRIDGSRERVSSRGEESHRSRERESSSEREKSQDKERAREKEIIRQRSRSRERERRRERERSREREIKKRVEREMKREREIEREKNRELAKREEKEVRREDYVERREVWARDRKESIHSSDKTREERDCVSSSNHGSPSPVSPLNLVDKRSPPASPRRAATPPRLNVKQESASDSDDPDGSEKDYKPSDKDSKAERTGEEPHKKALVEKYICESPGSVKSGASPPASETGSSALESLQGLVYGKSFNTEHPLDSLQKLIHNTSYSSSQFEGGKQNGTLITATSALQQALPGTVILVNPIVTVMPGSTGGSPSVSISIPPDRGTSPVLPDSKDSPLSPGGDKNLSDTDGDSTGEYRCQACKRHFASKGSYRYHLSRCHVLSTVKKYQIKDSINSSPYVYLPLDHTAKFNKYYEMANELANKGK